MSEERNPILSYEEFRDIMDDEAEDLGIDDETADGRREWEVLQSGGLAINRLYEDLITQGKLRVVREVVNVDEKDGFICSQCKWSCLWEAFGLCDPICSCPGCGNPIKREG